MKKGSVNLKGSEIVLLGILYLPVSRKMDKWINHFFQEEYEV